MAVDRSPGAQDAIDGRLAPDAGRVGVDFEAGDDVEKGKLVIVPGREYPRMGPLAVMPLLA